jgi:tRNA pseudouridine32 synthase/23S rRNA pseudouridine746 synthase/23S rRNA pseudouridine1911/1915/1917 synthase
MNNDSANNRPLLDLLIEQFPESSKTTIRSWIKEGRVSVDGKPVTIASMIIAPEQKIILGNRKKFLEEGIRILYEDSHIVAVDKPEGILSVATDFQKQLTVHAFLKKRYYPAPAQVVHRLDQETSGVMIFARSNVAWDRLKKIFEAHDIERSYTAIVEGHFIKPSGTWQGYLVEDANYHVHQTKDETEGRLAITHFEVKAISKRYSRINCRLETGRKNQIRVHCQDAGYPIAGDKKYGAMTDPIKRLCLHAHFLSFNHPITGKKMSFESPIPEGFFKLVS